MPVARMSRIVVSPSVHQRIDATMTRQRRRLSNLFFEFENKMTSGSFITLMNLVFESFAQIAIQA